MVDKVIKAVGGSIEGKRTAVQFLGLASDGGARRSTAAR